MICRNSSAPRWWPLSCWFCLALLAAPAISWADSPGSASSPPSGSASESLPSGTPTSESNPTDPWASFDSLWSELKGELIASDADWQTLLASLDRLQIEAGELRSSWAESKTLLERSEEARLREREAAAAAIYQAERARDRWRIATILAALGAALALIF